MSAAFVDLRPVLGGPAFHKRFDDVLIVPGPPKGWPAGPVWDRGKPPGLEDHWANGLVVTSEPEIPDLPETHLDGACVWGGAVKHHFGHFTAEHCQRLLFSKIVMPDAMFVFSTPRGKSASPPGYFWAILDWFGIAREQVRLVHDAPLRVRELHVFRQGEQLHRTNRAADIVKRAEMSPLPEYIDGLTRLQTGRGLRPTPGRTLYVSRSRIAPHLVRIPGEAYLVEALRQAGVTVVWPETESFETQLRLYAEAETVIFAEGSSAHGRQFLGHLPQHIAILARRKGARFGEPNLRPRCDRLTYIDPIATNVFFVPTKAGGPMRDNCQAIIDQDVLLDGFGRLGVDLRPHWERDAYQAAHDADLDAWLAACVDLVPEERLATAINLMGASLLAGGMIDQAVRMRQTAARLRRGRGSRRKAGRRAREEQTDAN